jgi:hypothetical protein
MKKNKAYLYLVMAVFGAGLFCLGEFVLTAENLKSVSGSCIGLGAAVFCLGVGNFIAKISISKTENQEILRKKAIAVNDERNTRIREKVGAKINQIVVYALSVLVLALGFMGVDVKVILMVSSIFVLELVLAVGLTDHYSKLM